MSNKARRMLVLLLIILKEAGPTAACSSSCSSWQCDCRSRGLTSVPQDLPTDITELSLRYNAITTLNQSDFSGYRSLITLSLGYNQISMIHNKTFHNLTSLTNLFLSNNRLTTLPAGIFEGLGDLWSLTLHTNQLTSLPADIFVGLGSLWELSLNNNQLTSLPAGIFEGLGDLWSLSLNTNQLTSLSADIFEGLGNLRSLTLYSNQLTSLPADIFVGLGSLEDLWLHSNKLTSLPADIFVGLGSLWELYLNNNQLTSLPAGIFKGLGNLWYLWLHNNQLTSLSADIFEGLGNLERLYLQSNNIHSIETGTFNDTTKLRYLYLQNNNISTITADTFGNLPQLETLELSHNNISTFPVEDLSNLNMLSELTLDNNQLETLPLIAYDILASISDVNIDNNPWQCDCRMAPFKQRMNGSYPFENQIRCAGPANLTGQLLQDVNPEDLICEETTPVYSTASTKHMVTSTLSLSPVSSPTPFHLSEMSTSKALKLLQSPSTTPTADSNPGWSIVSTDSPFGFQSTMTESNTGPADGGIVLSVPLLATLGAIFVLLLICTIGFAVGCMYMRRQRDPNPLQGFSNTNPTGTSSGHDQISLDKVTREEVNTEDSQHIYNLPTDEDPDTAEYNTIGDTDQSESPHQDAGNRQSLDSFDYLNLTPSLPSKIQTGQIQHLGSSNDGYEFPSPSLYPGEDPQSHKYVNSHMMAAAAKDAAAGPQDVVCGYEND
ncbi:uncharacterized protein LOC144902787 [Branchiostoma floridae x Branchiostoma belcheri]